MLLIYSASEGLDLDEILILNKRVARTPLFQWPKGYNLKNINGNNCLVTILANSCQYREMEEGGVLHTHTHNFSKEGLATFKSIPVKKV